MPQPDDQYRTKWHRLITPGSVQAYAFATLCVAIATFLHWAIGLITRPDAQVFTTFYPAVLLSTLVGGAGVGLYAAIVSGIIAWGAFLTGQLGFFSVTLEDAVGLVV